MTAPGERMEQLVAVIKALIQRLESHQEGGCCHLDARDRNAIQRGKDAINAL